jgi:methylmalonyl-CoA mutase, C-terminal domain
VSAAEPSRVRPRVLLAKSFIDSHDRAIETIAKVLRDAGMEVILLDYELARQVSSAADQEDVDVIGVSFMSGGQVEVTKELFASMEELGVGDIPVVVGGTIRPFDVPELEGAGVRAIFRGGEALDSIVKTFGDLAAQSRN